MKVLASILGAGLVTAALAVPGAWGAAGQLSAGYGHGGVSTIELRGTAGAQVGIGAAVAEPDGAVIAGVSLGISGPAQVVRLNPAGQLDPSFAITTFPTWVTVSRLALDPAGNIVVVGSTESASFLTRLLPNGGMDPAFNGGTPVPLSASPSGLVIDTAGRPVVAVPVPGQVSVTRFTARGAPDDGFGNGGTAALPVDSTTTGGPVAVTGTGTYVAVAERENETDCETSLATTICLGPNTADSIVFTLSATGTVVRTSTLFGMGVQGPQAARVDANGDLTVIGNRQMERLIPPYVQLDPSFGAGQCGGVTGLDGQVFAPDGAIVGHGASAPTLVTADGRPDLGFGSLGEAVGAAGGALTATATGVYVVGDETLPDGDQAIISTRFDRGPAVSATGSRVQPDSIMTFSAAGDAVPSGMAATTTLNTNYAGSPAPACGGLVGTRLNQPVVGGAVSPTAVGYWMVAADGGIFTFGDARFYGSTGAIKLNRPIVGMAATPDGHGYWMVASDGGIFAFGDAAFYGSTGGMRLNRPIVAMAATPDGHGYWMVASDGGIFTFGDARFYGSTGAIKLNRPIVGMAPTTDGRGYWLAAADGGIFTFGDATYFGGGPSTGPPFVAISRNETGVYELYRSDGENCAGGMDGPQGTLQCSPSSAPLHAPLVVASAT